LLHKNKKKLPKFALRNGLVIGWMRDDLYNEASPIEFMNECANYAANHALFDVSWQK